MNVSTYNVGTSLAVQIIWPNTNRTSYIVAHNDENAVVYYGYEGEVTTTTGFPIFPRQYIFFHQPWGDEVNLEWYNVFAISDTAGVTVAVDEHFHPRPTWSLLGFPEYLEHLKRLKEIQRHLRMDPMVAGFR